jgi:hypothetical protein
MLYRIIVTAISLTGAVLLSASTWAGDFQLNFGEAFSGTAPSSAATPWVTALFQDVAPGTVRLTISNVNLTATENVDEFYLNLNPSMNPTLLAFASAGASGAFDTPTISKGVNGFKADGDGYYDVELNFATGGTDANRFTDNESLTYDISGITGLMASDFAYLSSPGGGSGPFYAAAHVQRIGGSGASGWIDPTGNQIVLVPEPATATIAVAGLALLAGRRLRRK